MSKIQGMLASLRLSPSGIRQFENCRAGFIFSRIMFPRTETAKATNTTNVGKKFHELAEHAFDPTKTKEALVYEKESTLQELSEFQETLESRDYYKLPSVKEEMLSWDVHGLGTLVGIPDRVVDTGDGTVLIVDYKTSAFAYSDTDRRQVLSYAYLMWKAKGVEPEKITVLLDYVRAQEQFQYKLTQADLERHENYLLSRFRGIRKLLLDFEKDPDISKLPHSPGNCNLCFMVGMCLPYQMVLNPHYSPTDPQDIPTTDLIKEKLDREELAKVNKLRLEALGRTLMFRLEHNLPEPGDTEGRTYKDIIEEHLTKVQGTLEDYDAKEVMKLIVPLRAQKLVKGLPFSEFVDMQALYNIVTDIILEHIPSRLQRSAVPEDLRKKVEHLKQKRSKAPYLRVKS